MPGMRENDKQRTAATTTATSEAILKHDNNPGAPIVISQKSKNDKRKAKFDTPNNSLTDEGLDDLRIMGYRL